LSRTHFYRSALLSVVLILFSANRAVGQNTVSAAGFGYSLPTNSISAAPGQVLVVSVAGLNLTIDGPIQGIPDFNGLPTQLKGVSVDFVQGPVTVQLGLRGLQQGTCAAAAPCDRSTSITLQVPFELDPGLADAATPRIKLNGTVAGEVGLSDARQWSAGERHFTGGAGRGSWWSMRTGWERQPTRFRPIAVRFPSSCRWWHSPLC